MKEYRLTALIGIGQNLKMLQQIKERINQGSRQMNCPSLIRLKESKEKISLKG